uniref:Amidohydrolase 2 n=1 Tax=uncultured bacterium contig00018 TaxID=1181509 RepID=A0A806KFI1_9BACT|nr:amidohydrolase 2 [uncultured bacterium contig00018]
MIVDFHTHVFPDDIAARTISMLSAGIDGAFTPVNNGTVSGLIHDMDNWNIDISVVQPVVTKQSQTKSINEWAKSICSDRLISFGGIYPYTDDYKRDIDYIAGLGLKGLKFHPEYQNFIVDDTQMLKIYDYALSKGLILLYHAGADPAFQPPFKSTPRQFAKIVKAMQGGIIIAAHLGGHEQWDDVENYLVGTDIYLDTSMGFDYFPHDQFLRIVKNHGADKILFASDYPWSNAKTEMEQLKTLPLSGEDIRAILGDNAKRILT